MIIDASAVVAMYRNESAAKTLTQAVANANTVWLSAPSYLEASIVIDNRDEGEARRLLDDYLEESNIVVVPFTPEQARIARRAYQRYGKGSGHPARLNFGDCFAYALSVQSGEPLLFVGEDFTHTDVLPALPS